MTVTLPEGEVAIWGAPDSDERDKIVRRLYPAEQVAELVLAERERAARMCDDLAHLMECGAGEAAPGGRLRQAARNIREGGEPLGLSLFDAAAIRKGE